MKSTFVCFAFAFFCGVISLRAQTFAPAGCEWYHTMAYGAFHSYYGGDTVVAGQACRKIVNKALTADPQYSMGLRVHDHPALYVYDNTDTIFVYNPFFSRFTPLYVFNVNEGDLVTLPVLPLDFGALRFVYVDSTFTFKVDSVRMKQYDTALLRTVYTHPVGHPDTNYVYHYGGFADSTGAYAQHIGCLAGGLLPSGEPAMYVLSDAEQATGALRCYTDPALAVKMISGICGIPPVEVSAIAKAVNAVVYPNPADDRITVTGLLAGSQFTVADITGRVVAGYITAADTITLPVSGLQPGVYILTYTLANGRMAHRQTIVAH